MVGHGPKTRLPDLADTFRLSDPRPGATASHRGNSRSAGGSVGDPSTGLNQNCLLLVDLQHALVSTSWEQWLTGASQTDSTVLRQEAARVSL